MSWLLDAELKKKLNKILASDYITTTPEMKAPGDVAAAVGKYVAPSQVQISESTVIQTDGAQVLVSYHHNIHPLHYTEIVKLRT